MKIHYPFTNAGYLKEEPYPSGHSQQIEFHPTRFWMREDVSFLINDVRHNSDDILAERVQP